MLHNCKLPKSIRRANSGICRGGSLTMASSQWLQGDVKIKVLHQVFHHSANRIKNKFLVAVPLNRISK